MERLKISLTQICFHFSFLLAWETFLSFSGGGGDLVDNIDEATFLPSSSAVKECQVVKYLLT